MISYKIKHHQSLDIFFFLATDLDVQLFNFLGVAQDKYPLYGVTFSQKNVMKCYHYGHSFCANILKSRWEEIKGNTTLMESPVNIPFIPFGETQDSEIPKNEMVLRIGSGEPVWGGTYITIFHILVSARCCLKTKCVGGEGGERAIAFWGQYAKR
jgi:hypothetical protein